MCSEDVEWTPLGVVIERLMLELETGTPDIESARLSAAQVPAHCLGLQGGVQPPPRQFETERAAGGTAGRRAPAPAYCRGHEEVRPSAVGIREPTSACLIMSPVTGQWPIATVAIAMSQNFAALSAQNSISSPVCEEVATKCP